MPSVFTLSGNSNQRLRRHSTRAPIHDTLPSGYRWATPEETGDWTHQRGIIQVRRHEHGPEATDLAVPISFSRNKKRKKRKSKGLGAGDYGPDELKLSMDNEGSIYRELQATRVRAVGRACREGAFSADGIASMFLPLVERFAAQYRREFGTRFTATEQLEVAHEYAQQLKRRINACHHDKRLCGDLPTAAVPILKSCKIPSAGFAGAKKQKGR